jgi:cell division protein FtsB
MTQQDQDMYAGLTWTTPASTPIIKMKTDQNTSAVAASSSPATGGAREARRREKHAWAASHDPNGPTKCRALRGKAKEGERLRESIRHLEQEAERHRVADVAHRAQHHSDLPAAKAREVDALAKLNDAQEAIVRASSENKVAMDQLKQSQTDVQHLEVRLEQMRTDRDAYHNEVSKLKKRVTDLEGSIQQLRDGRPIQLPAGDVKLIHTPVAMELRLRSSTESNAVVDYVPPHDAFTSQ